MAAWRQLGLTRGNVAHALEREHSCGFLAARVHVGVAGKHGAEGRARVHGEYVAALARSQVVVTCNPKAWEGDARLAEALSSGAVVLVDAMLNPPPGVVNGSSVLTYRSIDEMLSLVRRLAEPRWAAEEAERIAAAGLRLAREQMRPMRVVERLLGLVLGAARFGGCDGGGRNGSAPPVRLFWPDAAAAQRSYEYNFTLAALRQCAGVELVASAAAAELSLLELWSLSLSPAGRSMRRPLRRLLGGIAAQSGGRPVVGIDWSDSVIRVLDDARLTHYFKRSMVKRSLRPLEKPSRRASFKGPRRPLTDPDARPSALPPLGLWYPVKDAFAAAMERALAEARPRAERAVDVSCFFQPDANQPTAPAELRELQTRRGVSRAAGPRRRRGSARPRDLDEER